jgi:BirA family biotin operon repressor/biotin-[acetyl-CoA-carboxylase] ligase
MSVENAPAGSDGATAGADGSSAPDGRAGADGPVAWDAAGADSTGAAAFPRSRAVARELVVLPQAGSTNDEAVARVRTGELAAPFSTVATLDQRAGHGRQGRAWRTPAGSALAVSVVVRLESSPRLALLPLIAGAAMCRALRGLGVAAELKWPNDVLIGGAKVCGILCAVAAPGVVVIGSGVNLRFSGDDVAHLGLGGTRATALSLEGAVTDPDIVLSAYLAALRDGVADLQRDAVAALDAVRGVCLTIGQRVRVELPDGARVHGIAVAIGDDGALEVDTDRGLRRFLAGDVTHLRPEVE